MTLARTALLLQVVGSFVANGIITYETTVPGTFLSEDFQKEEHNSNWKSILKSAMFRTLIKYTGFSPSLDIKMEADSLLWEKLNGAKYTRKVFKVDDDGETLKTGVLIDLSRENGYLEFRQVDKSLYTLEPKDHRLLALWRMRLIQAPNHYIIQVKVPEDPPIEHVYEFSQTGGLKETNLKDVDYSRNKQNKNGLWKARQRKAYVPPIVYANSNSYSKRPHHYLIRSHQYNGNRFKLPQQTNRYGQLPRTYLHKPISQYYTVVGIQTPPPVQKIPTWSEYSYETTYPSNQVKDYTEFKQETEYDGFLPSLGPASTPSLNDVLVKSASLSSSTMNTPLTYQGSSLNNVPLSSASVNNPPTYQGSSLNNVPLSSSSVNNPPTYQGSSLNNAPLSSSSLTYQGSSSNEAVPYKQPTTTYYSPYTPDPIPSTPNPFPMAYFKPSTQFVQYSEADPFYSTQNNSYNTFGVINTAAAGLSLLGQYPLYYNALPTAAISVQVPPVEPGKSLYDSAINTIRINSTTGNEGFIENNAQPTATSFVVNYAPQTDDTTTESSQETTIEVNKSTTPEESEPKTRVKNSLRNPLRTHNSGAELYEYAPLYIKWGEKIKPSEKVRSTTQKIKTTTNANIQETPSTESSSTKRVTARSKIKQDNTDIGIQVTENKNISVSDLKNNTSLKPHEKLEELQKRRISLKSQKEQLQKHEENSKMPKGKGETLLNTKIKEPTNYSESDRDVLINNKTERTPEEVVRDYTTMGLQNSTTVENSENLRSAISKNNKAKEVRNDNENEGSEPVSVIVNRISQSYSYKTSEGESGNLKQLVEKT